MEYEKGYVYELMDEGGPTDNREPYFREAVEEMMRARVLCARANAKMPDDPTYVNDLEELFGRKLDDVRILLPILLRIGSLCLRLVRNRQKLHVADMLCQLIKPPVPDTVINLLAVRSDA